MKHRLLFASLLLLLGTTPAWAQINVGSTGADGAFDAAALDAADGNVDGIATVDLATMGTYDPATWRVVFHFTSVVVQQGITVRFENHPSRAPVVWLSQTDITIDGEVDLDGAAGSLSLLAYAEPGPGGFRGGIGQNVGNGSWKTSSGFGPGGGFEVGQQWGSGGSHANSGIGTAPGPHYGNSTIEQLVGGSGGSARNDINGTTILGGGAGGGAFLMGANYTVSLSATAAVHAQGGQGAWSYWPGTAGSGSGGAIRIVCDELIVAAGAALQASGGVTPGAGGFGAGGDGWIRLEANQFQVGTQSSPAASVGPPGPIAVAAGSMTIKIIEVGGLPAPSDPSANLGTGSAIPDMDLPTGPMTQVVIETTNVPLDSAIYLRMTRASGPSQEMVVTDGVTNPLVVTGGPELQARTTLEVDLTSGITALQARAVLATP